MTGLSTIRAVGIIAVSLFARGVFASMDVIDVLALALAPAPKKGGQAPWM